VIQGRLTDPPLFDRLSPLGELERRDQRELQLGIRRVPHDPDMQQNKKRVSYLSLPHISLWLLIIGRGDNTVDCPLTDNTSLARWTSEDRMVSSSCGEEAEWRLTSRA